MAARRAKKTKAETAAPKRGKRGMTPFVPTDRDRMQVRVMVGLGMTYREVCEVIVNPRTGRGIALRTLQDHFPEDLKAAAATVKSRVYTSLFARAVDMNHPQGAACAIFMAKCRFGWRETSTLEVQGTAGVLVAPAAMTPEEWIARAQQANEKKSAPE